LFSNYVEARTVVPPAGAFNADSTHNGGYGDKVGTGQMSCYPVAAISADGIGLAWGVDMGIPLVYRLAYDPIAGMIAEYDFATAKGTKKFPNRAFFKMHLFECDPVWHLRAALEKYYTMQLEYFQKRVTQEGIWLPFAPLCEIRGWEDFGFAFHETNVHSIDSGLHPPVTTISAGKIANVLTFQYTEPWEEEIPLQHHDPTYEEIAGGGVIPPEHAGYFGTSTALDKANKWIVRKLETPWFSSGWALSVNTNTDPDIMGFNRYDYVSRREIQPALAMDVDGIYFDCLEWHWQYDMNYNAAHFEYTDYPLTFSSSLDMPRPVIWSYASDYEFVKNIADQMHAQGKYVMGNSFCWIPFAAGLLDVFGSELSLYVPGDMALARLKYARSMAHDKPVVFLLNEGLDDALFTRPPYAGYTSYFDRMLLYGFFPSFFSVNATSNIYWADSSRYDQGRPFFRKYIPLIRAISKAGWQPVTFARLHPSTLSIERFGPDGSKTHYFTVYNPTAQQVRAVISIDARALNLTEHVQIAELLEGAQTECTKRGDTVEVVLTVGGNAARLIKVTTE
jgi:hypothetical protein